MSSYDLFGHYISSNVTFKPKDKVRINVPGPFDGLTGYVVNYVGDHKYTVNVPDKNITLTFHKSELLNQEKI